MGSIRKALLVTLWSLDLPADVGLFPANDPSGADFLPGENGWTDLGRTAVGAPPEQSHERSTSSVRSHQSYEPERIDVESVDGALNFTLLETSATSLAMAFGGGVTTVAGNRSHFEPPDPFDINEKGLILEIRDGAYRGLKVFRRTMPGLSGAITHPRTGEDPIQYPITATILNPGNGLRSFYAVDNAAFEDGGS